MNIGIFLDGGIVQSIVSDKKANVVVVDYDTEGADKAEELHEVFGNEAYAIDFTNHLEVNPEAIKEVFESTGAKMDKTKEADMNDIKFLMDLKEELNAQDRDSQAHPRFWVLKDYKVEPVAEGFQDGYKIYYPSSAEGYDLEEDMKEKAQQEGLDYDDLPDEYEEDLPPKLSELVEAITSYNSYRGDSDLYLDWVKEYEDEDVYIVPVAMKSFLVPNTFFITKEEAERHIEQNDYHYSSRVHTYAMTAWRSPKVEKLFDILYNTDWEKLNRLINEKQ